MLISVCRFLKVTIFKVGFFCRVLGVTDYDLTISLKVPFRFCG